MHYKIGASVSECLFFLNFVFLKPEGKKSTSSNITLYWLGKLYRNLHRQSRGTVAAHDHFLLQHDVIVVQLKGFENNQFAYSAYVKASGVLAGEGGVIF